MLLAFAFLAGCSGAPPAVKPAPTEPTIVANPSVDLQRWRTIKANGGAVPAGTTARELLPELVQLLASTDPEVRDGIGYEVVTRWAMPDGQLDDAGVRALAAALRPRLRRGLPADGESDAAFGRSFAALALSVVAARDVAAPTLEQPELDALIDDALWYAHNETDYRGHTGANGWCHAAAHTADLLKFLARNPRVSAARGPAILAALTSIATRRHGTILHHGEELRSTAVVAALLPRNLVTTAEFEAWVRTLIEPLTQPNEPFEAALYAAQRNATSLLLAMVAQFELMDPRPPEIEAARAILVRLLRE